MDSLSSQFFIYLVNLLTVLCYPKFMTEYGNQFAQAIAEELRAQKARTGKTNEDIAEEIGVSAVTVLRYLRGQRQIPIDVFGDLCQALGVNAADITAIAFTKAQKRSESINPLTLTEEEKKQFVLNQLKNGDTTLAANYDPNKEAERDYYPDAGA
ncbi:helix-turn-helix domain-containing protein [Bifidobacterium psychraerophilum]|uniref:helix-turn-helix domain-containing protein n=1 Tax=Bifidobacterium psychraerophilum TaxID=218140 RepID=UPI00333F5BFF